MKKTLIALFMLLPFIASAQTTFLTDGITHNIAPGYISGDSIHVMGIIDMRDNVFAADSFNIAIEAGDSLNFRVYCVPLQDLSAETVADSVAGCAATANVATGGFQMTADGFALVPWHNILAAITSHRAKAKAYRVYVRVFAVGSEVASSGKKFKAIARVFN